MTTKRKPPRDKLTSPLFVRATPEQRQRWQHAAEEDGRSESDWARRALDAAARKWERRAP